MNVRIPRTEIVTKQLVFSFLRALSAIATSSLRKKKKKEIQLNSDAS